jgi:hypothetical protein
MADVTKSFRASELRHRVLELSRKWLPMLLSRVGVEHAATLRIRQGSEDEAVLRGQLQFARVVTVAAAKRSKGGQNEDLSQHALAVIAALERVNRTLLGLVVGRRPDPREIDAIDRSSTWWSRLLARSGVAGAAY